MGFINLHSVAKFSKKSRSDEKNESGVPLVSSGLVGYVKIVKMKGGPFALSLHWPSFFRDLSSTK